MIREANLDTVKFEDTSPGLFILRSVPAAAQIFVLSTGVDVVDEGLVTAVNDTTQGHLSFVLHDEEAEDCMTVDQLAEVYGKRIRKEYRRKEGFEYGPIVIVGDSFAGDIANEVALYLEREGEAVSLNLYTQDWLDSTNRLLSEG